MSAVDKLNDSVGWNVAHKLVTVVMVPAAFMIAKIFYDKLDDIQRQQTVAAVTVAELVIKVQELKDRGISTEEAVRQVKEQVMRHDYELKLLQQRR